MQQFVEQSHRYSVSWQYMNHITRTTLLIGLTLLATTSSAFELATSAGSSVRVIGPSSTERVGEDVEMRDNDAPEEPMLSVGISDPSLSVPFPSSASIGQPSVSDRLWMISTRCLTSDYRAANVHSPDLAVTTMDRLGNRQSVEMDSFLSGLDPSRPLVLHVHGNRMTEQDANERGRFVHRNLLNHLPTDSFDFVVFSWPSEKTGILVKDGRNKARMTEAEGLYLGWLLKELVGRQIPVAIVSYSFGSRVATGALHTLAGGSLGGRRLPGEPIRGISIPVALVAPALEGRWLEPGQYHGLASQNISQLAVFYNSRDAVLKRYWLIEPGSAGQALGFTGPRRVPRGFDGTPLPLIARDCTRTMGIAHSEREYYLPSCSAAPAIAGMIAPLLNGGRD